jgi:hypothetical protein
MARQRDPRAQPRTLLIYGEGDDEADFASHIKSCFAIRGGNLVGTVRRGSGGSPATLLGKARRIPGEFVKRVILLDSDIPTEPIRVDAATRGVELLVSRPALEGLLLRILGLPSPLDTNLCRSALAKQIGPLRVPTDWERHFPQAVLEAALKRTNDPALDVLRRLVALVRGEELTSVVRPHPLIPPSSPDHPS